MSILHVHGHISCNKNAIKCGSVVQACGALMFKHSQIANSRWGGAYI